MVIESAPHRAPVVRFNRGTVLASFYLGIKALHVITVIAWMAGLLYLPRLFVYHAKAELGSSSSETFKVMEEKLVRIIMTPAMIVAWVCGLAMIGLNPELLRSGWLPVKLLFVVALTVIHFMMNGWRRDFARDSNHRSERFFRIANELPTLAMIVIVIMVIVRPF
jgi:putative membrane protein